MKEAELERELRLWIGERRRGDEREAPPYRRRQPAARFPRARTAGHGLAVAAALLCAVVGVVVARSKSMRLGATAPAIDLAAWRPPTEPLLATPELELLDSAPDFGTDSLPEPLSGTARKEHRP